MKSYAEIAEHLESDGALRDFYIESTSAGDWDRLIAHIRTMAVRYECSYNGYSVPLPTRFSDIQAMQLTDMPVLHVTVAGAVVNCHFFCAEELEMDFRPEDFRNPNKWGELLVFLQSVVDVIGKEGIITMENCKAAVIDRLEPRRKAEPAARPYGSPAAGSPSGQP
jgi:hypothetical protein